MKDIKNYMVNETNSHNNDYEYWNKLWSEVNNILHDLSEQYNDSEIINAILNEIGAKKALTIIKKIKANGVYPK